MRKKTHQLVTITILIVISLLGTRLTYSQDPGDIFNTSNLGASNPMDPNNDDFITTSGLQFSGTNELAEFELPFIEIPQLEDEPSGDSNGVACSNRDLVGNLNPQASTGYYYIDTINNVIIFRLRVGSNGNGASGYSVLMDTDNLFGNLDPNYIAGTTSSSGNPGFEREIIASNNNGGGASVSVVNIDGATTGTEINSYPVSSNRQKSRALNTTDTCVLGGDDEPVFVDFFVPLADVGIIASSEFRLITATSSSVSTALGNTASDIGGVNTANYATIEHQFNAALFAFDDVDNDGISNVNDLDDDNDGILDVTEVGTNPDADADFDGIPAYLDDDDTNDVIGDTNGVEAIFDFDGDGVANHQDLDSDNDGIYDLLEVGGADIDNDGLADNPADLDSDGLPDIYDASCTTAGAVSGNATDAFLAPSGSFANPDDAEGTTGLSDTDFAVSNVTGTSFLVLDLGLTVPPGTSLIFYLGHQAGGSQGGEFHHSDVNGDVGIIPPIGGTSYSVTGNGPVAFTETTIVSTRYIRVSTFWENVRIYGIEYTTPGAVSCSGTTLVPIQTNGTPDYLNLDADGDGCNDVLEAGFTDVDNDGMIDGSGGNSNGIVDGTNGYTGTSSAVTDSGNLSACVPTDTDNDGVLDAVDLDDDNDGILDTDEGLTTCASDIDWNTTNITESTFSVPVIVAADGVITGATTVTDFADIDITIQVTAMTGDWGMNFVDGQDGITLNNSVGYTPGANHSITYIMFLNKNAALTVDHGGGVQNPAEEYTITVPSGIITINDPSTQLTHSGSGTNSVTFRTTANTNAATTDWTIDLPAVSQITVTRTDLDNTIVGGAVPQAARLDFTTSMFCDIDTDSDGISDHLDTDTDDDGCSDANEAYDDINTDGGDDELFGTSPVSVNPDGTVIGASYATGVVAAVTDDAISTACILDDDNDGIANSDDTDDDNDGIRDIIENGCNNEEQYEFRYTHNRNFDPDPGVNPDLSSGENDLVPTIGDATPPVVIASATNETIGIGLNLQTRNPSLDQTFLQFTGVDQANLTAAIANDEYIEFQFTTGSAFLSAAIESFSENPLSGTDPVQFNEHEMAVLISNDAFSSDTTTLIQDYVVANTPTGFLFTNFEAPYFISASTTYTVRVYLYNTPPSASNTATFDDFGFVIRGCNGQSLDFDGDGIVNSLDLDSDNDGIYDIVEEGGVDTDDNGITDNLSDLDNDGLADLYDEDCSQVVGTIEGNGVSVSAFLNFTNTTNATGTSGLSDTDFSTSTADGDFVILALSQTLPAGSDITFYVGINSGSNSGQFHLTNSDGTTDIEYLGESGSIFAVGPTAITRTTSVDADFVRFTVYGNGLLFYGISFEMPNIVDCSGGTYLFLDSDSDSFSNSVDLDSDGDLCNDVLEAGFIDGDTNGLLGTGTFGSGLTVNTDGVVTSGSDGYTIPADADSTLSFDFIEFGASPSISLQPVNQSVSSGASAIFTVTVTNTTDFQWQESTDGGGSFTDIPEGGIYTGTDTNTLTINPAGTSLNNNRYQLVMSNSAYICSSTITSDAAILGVAGVTILTNRNTTYRVNN